MNAFEDVGNKEDGVLTKEETGTILLPQDQQANPRMTPNSQSRRVV